MNVLPPWTNPTGPSFTFAPTTSQGRVGAEMLTREPLRCSGSLIGAI